MAGTTPRQFQSQQNGKHGALRRAQLPDQLVHRHRGGTQRFFHLCPNLAGFRLPIAGRSRGWSIFRFLESGAQDRPQRRQYIGCASVSVAPSRSSRLQPCARESSGEPGTAKISRPCSNASRAVISDPDRAEASTTTVPNAMPEMSRLRRGK